MSNNHKMFRQGDVLIVACANGIPSDAVEQPASERGVIVQAGNATGHAHRIPSGAAKLFVRGESRYLRIVEPVGLIHEEHKTACATCGELATKRTDRGYAGADYFCDAHASSACVALSHAGETTLPAMEAQIVIHHEYEPGELSRQVED